MICTPLIGAFIKDETTLEDPNLESSNSSTLNTMIEENCKKYFCALLKLFINYS